MPALSFFATCFILFKGVAAVCNVLCVHLERAHVVYMMCDHLQEGC